MGVDAGHLLAESCVGVPDVALGRIEASPKGRRSANSVVLVVVAIHSEKAHLARVYDLIELLGCLLHDPIAMLPDEVQVWIVQQSVPPRLPAGAAFVLRLHTMKRRTTEDDCRLHKGLATIPLFHRAFVGKAQKLARSGDGMTSRKSQSFYASLLFFNASHAALCLACHGVRSHPVPVALVGECSIPVV